MESGSRRTEFISSIKKIKRMFSDLNFIFETELTPEKTLEIASADNNFFVTYDTGNVTSYLKQHEKYIKTLKNKIVNVHLKDRTFDAKTQIPFNGDTDFKTIFKLLKEIDYNSIYTLQIARGETGKEVEYIKEYKQKFEDLHEQFFV
jgi:sugar phosphate isomerase/epimerase